MTGKVICIGAPKTGTTSLSFALLMLGYKTSLAGFSRMPTEFSYQSICDFVLSDSEHFDAMQDTPWYCFYKDLDKKYPNSKFILTIRNTDSWYTSWINMFNRDNKYHKLTKFLFFEGKTLKHNKENYIAQYEKRNSEIINYFKDRPENLLILNLEKGIGWNELCTFLNKRVPSVPYPRIRPQDFKTKDALRLIRSLRWTDINVLNSIDLGKEWVQSVPNKTYRVVFYLKKVLIICSKLKSFFSK